MSPCDDVRGRRGDLLPYRACVLTYLLTKSFNYLLSVSATEPCSASQALYSASVSTIIFICML